MEDLDLFYDKVKFGNLGFDMVKSEHNDYFIYYCSPRPER